MQYVNLDNAAGEIRDMMETCARDLPDYSGYLCDALNEMADSAVSIYTADLLEFARDNAERVNDAACEFGLQPDEYGDWIRYTEAAASFAWNCKAREEIDEELYSALKLVAIDELRRRGLEEVPREAYFAAVDFDAFGVDDLDEFRKGSFDRYLEAIEAE